MNFGPILIDITITFFAFTLAPFIRFGYVKNMYSYEQKKKFIIWNSIVVQLAFIIILAFMDSEKYNITPAFLYYFVNQWLWNNKKHIEI